MNGFKQTMGVYLLVQLCIILSALSFFAVVSGGYISSAHSECPSNSTHLFLAPYPAFINRVFTHNVFLRKEIMLPNTSVIFLGDILFVKPEGISSYTL